MVASAANSGTPLAPTKRGKLLFETKRRCAKGSLPLRFFKPSRLDQTLLFSPLSHLDMLETHKRNNFSMVLDLGQPVQTLKTTRPLPAGLCLNLLLVIHDCFVRVYCPLSYGTCMLLSVNIFLNCGRLSCHSTLDSRLRHIPVFPSHLC